MAAAKAAGKVRMEGKDYVMHDGDVVEFRTGLTSGGKKWSVEHSFFSTTHDYILGTIGKVMFCWGAVRHGFRTNRD